MKVKVRIELRIYKGDLSHEDKTYNGILISRVPTIGEYILIDGYNGEVKSVLHRVGEISEIDASIFCVV